MSQFKEDATFLPEKLLSWGKKSGRAYVRRYGGFVFLAVALTTAALIIFLDGQRLSSYTFRLNPFLVLLSVLIEFSGLILAVPAWHLILARFDSSPSYMDDLRIYCYTILGVAIPGGIWPLVGRVALYERQGVAGVAVSIATIAEFVLMGLAGLAVYSFTLILHPQTTLWQRPEIALSVTILVLILVQPPLFNRVVAFILRRAYHGNRLHIPFRYIDLGLLLLLEILTVLVGGTAIYILLQSFVTVPSNFYITVVGAWAAGVAASSLFFWFPGKPILRDGAIALVLAQVLSPALAVAFVIILRIWTIGSVLLAAGLAWLFLKHSSAPSAQ